MSRKGKVYDVTGFLVDHPGGEDLILNYAGKDVEEIMKDTVEHEHSDSAYDMLDEYVIGRLGAEENIVSEGMYGIGVADGQRVGLLTSALLKTGKQQMTSTRTKPTRRRTLRKIISLTYASRCCARSGTRTSGKRSFRLPVSSRTHF